MEQLVTYIIKSKLNGYIWRFKYHLNGSFKSFEILEGNLNAAQVLWLFGGKNAKEEFQLSKFPVIEDTIKVWQSLLKDNFEISIEQPDLSFEALWNLYGYKAKRIEAEKSFKKLKEPDIIKVFLSIPGYNKYMTKKSHDKAHLSSFINKRYFEDDWSKVI
jgi:hypothetical protein